MKVFVTGFGISSPIGNNEETILNSLKNKKHGLVLRNYRKGDFIVGEVPLSNECLLKKHGLSYPKSRTALLGIEALSQLKNKLAQNSDLKTGLIVGTSVGGMDYTEVNYENIESNKGMDFSIHSSGNVTEALGKYIGNLSYINTISTACSSSTNAIIQGARLIKHGVVDRVIVGGTDAICDFTINGFNSLMIYSNEFNKPFDENRKGLNLGEGAAFILLESEKSQKLSQNKILADYKGGGNASDAFHQTATSENGIGAQCAMNEAINESGIESNEIAYINVHGTSTPNNDLTEGRALELVFSNKVPDFSSTKGFTGHTLAASGAIEAVFCLLALKEQHLLPNLGFETKIKEHNIEPNTEWRNQEIKYIMSNAFGFGGNCSSIIFESHD
jgi:3-oxoacyl-[acyl-carrier-protein] synthase II